MCYIAQLNGDTLFCKGTYCTCQRYNGHRNHTSNRVTVIPQKWSYSQHITLNSALRTERLSVCTVLRDLMLACTLPAVTPPLVNTGLEVSSVDKNTLASQQRGRKARILLSSATIVHEELKTSALLCCCIWQICNVVKFKYTKVVRVSQSRCLQRWAAVLVNACILCSICWGMWNLFGNVELCF